MKTSVGSVELPNPVMTASGTAGHGAELSAYFDLSELGAIVVKSLAAEPWPGNPAPRVHGTPAGMLNSVGLQGPGVEAWITDDLPQLRAAGARVVASIWGRRVGDFEKAAAMLHGAPGVVAVEVNVSCPNLEARGEMFAHSAGATADAVAAAAACGLPRWAKLSPSAADLVDIAGAAAAAGAEAVVLVNTMLGMQIDPANTRSHPPSPLARGGGGYSGPALLPIAVRAVFDVRSAHPALPIVGVGGVWRGVDGAQLLAAGADAVEVGTASLADPRAPVRVLEQLRHWCQDHGITELKDLVGRAHRAGT